MLQARSIDVVYLHPDDNVCVAAANLPEGREISTAGDSSGRGVKLTSAVKQGHKIALARVAAGEPVRKYGQIIGFATQSIEPGDWVHTHNLMAGQFDRDYAAASDIPPDPPWLEGHTFQGYRRADGKAGTRNYIAIISTVNCSASVSKYVAQRFDTARLKQFPNVDGIVA